MATYARHPLEHLIDASAKGDERAYGEVVRRFQARAVAYAFGILGDFHVAEDATQEAFVEAYLKLETLRSRQAFGAWLRRIIYKHCYRAARRKRPAASSDGGREPADTRTPARLAETREARDSVTAALGRLPQRERVVLTLFYMEGRSHNEIADFLGTTSSAVKSRLHSARGRLKERLMKMTSDEIKRHAPDKAFAKKVAGAIAVFTARGPAESQIGSTWHGRVLGKIRELCRMGDEGFEVAVELARAGEAKARQKAALHFGLARNPRGREHLVRLMKDPNSAVRRTALQAYARLISPADGEGRLFGAENEYSRWAESVPDGIEAVGAMLSDTDVKVRWYAVLTLRPYARLGDARVEGALAKALADAAHKVRHAAALARGIACPGCGKKAEAQTTED